MHVQIQTYLSEEPRDYMKGLALFAGTSRNRAIYLYLSRKQDEKKLIYELEKILERLTPKSTGGTPVSEKKTPTPEPETTPIVLKPKTVNPEELPEELKTVYNEVTEKYKLQRAIHEKMKLAATDEDRAALRGEIVKLDDDITLGWSQVDGFINGIENNAKIIEQKCNPDPLSIVREVNAARKYISVNLPKLTSLNDGQRDLLKSKILERYNTLVHLQADISTETADELVRAGILMSS